MKRLFTLLLICLLGNSIYANNISWLITPQYDEISEFVEGVAIVKQGDKLGYIKLSGEVISPCQFDKLYPFSEGVGVATDKGNKIVAIVHKDGRVITSFSQPLVIDPRYGEFSEELLLVSDGVSKFDRNIGMNIQKWGYINKEGSIKHSIKYFFALPFSDGLACVAPYLDFNYLYTYINTNGEIIIRGSLNNEKNALKAFSFHNNEAIIIDKTGLVRIDKRGNRLERIIKFTPSENPYIFMNSSLKSTDGELQIDTRGRAASYRNSKSGNKIEFVSQEKTAAISTSNSFTFDGQLYSSNADWQSADIAKVVRDGKYGLVQVVKEPLAIIETQVSRVVSIFGNISPIGFFVKSRVQESISQVGISIGDKTINLDELKSSGYEFIFELGKQTDNAVDEIFIPYAITSQALLLNEGKIKMTIVDQPSIEIVSNKRYVVVDEGVSSYSLDFTVSNNSDFDLSGAKVYFNGKESSAVDVAKNSKIVISNRFPISQTSISLEIKPQKSPVVSYTHKVDIKINRVEEQKQDETKEAKQGGELGTRW